jgi:hypothetical protein
VSCTFSHTANIPSRTAHPVTPRTSCCAPSIQSGGQISVTHYAIASNPTMTLGESSTQQCCCLSFSTWPHSPTRVCYSTSHGNSQLRAPLATEDCGTQSRDFTQVGNGSAGSVHSSSCSKWRTPLRSVAGVSLHTTYPLIAPVTYLLSVPRLVPPDLLSSCLFLYCVAPSTRTR